MFLEEHLYAINVFLKLKDMAPNWKAVEKREEGHVDRIGYLSCAFSPWWNKGEEKGVWEKKECFWTGGDVVQLCVSC